MSGALDRFKKNARDTDAAKRYGTFRITHKDAAEIQDEIERVQKSPYADCVVIPLNEFQWLRNIGVVFEHHHKGADSKRLWDFIEKYDPRVK